MGNNDWGMNCGCKSEACCDQIGPVSSIPQETLDYYQKLGALPNFIKSQLQTSSHSPRVEIAA